LYSSANTERNLIILRRVLLPWKTRDHIGNALQLIPNANARIGTKALLVAVESMDTMGGSARIAIIPEPPLGRAMRGGAQSSRPVRP
jgi:hypothetical protein